jgi:hypothetical protein
MSRMTSASRWLARRLFVTPLRGVLTLNAVFQGRRYAPPLATISRPFRGAHLWQHLPFRGAHLWQPARRGAHALGFGSVTPMSPAGAKE